MASYEIEKKIHSCFVDKKLLEDLETYILNIVEEGREEGGKGSLDLSENLSICLFDNYGTEQLKSIKNYKRDKFSNDIRVICMCYKDIYNDYRKIKITFGIIDTVSKIEIKNTGYNPKEKVQGALQVMENYIHQNKNINYFFFETIGWLIPMLLGGSLVGIGVYIFNDIMKGPLGFIGTISIPLFIITLILAVFSSVSPYCVIDTKKNENNRKIIGWLLKGLAGVFIFGVIAIAIRKKIFGI